jgi:hypothetical protein
LLIEVIFVQNKNGEKLEGTIYICCLFGLTQLSQNSVAAVPKI